MLGIAHGAGFMHLFERETNIGCGSFKILLGILKFLAPPCFATSPRSCAASLLRRGNLRGVAHQTAVGAASPLFDH
jgi:hypothetical protein